MNDIRHPGELITVPVGELMDFVCLTLREDRSHLYDQILNRAPLPTDLDDALHITARIAAVLALQVQLKAAFAKRELDGGALAALDHPLWARTVAELDSLRDELVQLA